MKNITLLIYLLVVTYSCKKDETTPSSQLLSITITTLDITDIQQTTANCGGKITNKADIKTLNKGICWSTHPEPTILDSIRYSDALLDSFRCEIDNLLPNHEYYVRSFVSTKTEIIYGSSKILITNDYLIPKVQSLEIGIMSQNLAYCGGKIISDGGASIFELGICWSMNSNFSNSSYLKVTNSSYEAFDGLLSGLTPNETYYFRAYALNCAGISYGEIMSFKTPALLIDIDKNVYKTVTIGNQTWMAENLRVTKFNDGVPIPHVSTSFEWGYLLTPGYCWYNSDSINYSKPYGAYYNWYTIETGKLCPVGWHVPTDAEWQVLEQYLGVKINSSTDDWYGYFGTNEGSKLASESGLWTNGILDENPSFGKSLFMAVPSSDRDYTGKFGTIGNHCCWFTATEESNEYAWVRAISYFNCGILRNSFQKQCGFSIRCVKD